MLGQRPSANPTLASQPSRKGSLIQRSICCAKALWLCRGCFSLSLNWAGAGSAKQTVCALQSPGKIFGPATALAGLLRRNGWSLAPDGAASGPGHAKLHLCRHRPKAVRRAVSTAWLSQIPAKVGGRNGMLFAGVPCPDLADKVLSRFEPGWQVHLAQTMVGGFMSNAARSTWDPLQCPSCVLCGMLDHKRHRPLECPATAPLRRLYQPLLSWIETHQPHWLHCPFPVAHEAEDFLRLFWHSRKMVPPGVWRDRRRRCPSSNLWRAAWSALLCRNLKATPKSLAQRTMASRQPGGSNCCAGPASQVRKPREVAQAKDFVQSIGSWRERQKSWASSMDSASAKRLRPVHVKLST